MTSAKTLLSKLKRPKILLRAARLGMVDYQRSRDLKIIAKTSRLPSPSRAVETLIEQERSLEENRKKGDASYSIRRHINVLAALLAEVQLLPRKKAV